MNQVSVKCVNRITLNVCTGNSYPPMRLDVYSMCVCMDMSDYIYFPIVPGEPQNLMIISPDSTSLMLSWDHPLPQDRNGIITDYLIYVQISDGSEEIFMRNANSNETTFTVEGLEEFIEYNISVAAVTGAGEGNETGKVIQRTLNDSEL